MRPSARRPALLALAIVTPFGAVLGQGAAKKAQAQDPVKRVEGRRIARVTIEGSSEISPRQVLPDLRTKRGGKLEPLSVRDDLAFLWNRYKVRARVTVRELKDGEVHVRFIVLQSFFRYDRVRFRGNREFDEKEIRKFLEIGDLERLTELSAETLARRLEDRYRRDGYANVKVTVRPDEKASEIELLVDEGPRARVRSFEVLGNRAFPESFQFGLGWNLLGSAKIKSQPGFWSDPPYSTRVLAEDIDRLRAFYRGRGYKDATVELHRLDFSDDFTGVEVSVRVHEGRLYTVDRVDIEIQPHGGNKKPLFSAEELRKEIELEQGDVPTADKLERDRIRIRRFYGRRGFPSRDAYPDLDAATSFFVRPPDEVVDPQKGTVRVIYRIEEGARKSVGAVKIGGNQFTKDRVIRRELGFAPGDQVNTEDIERSQDRLLALRYFGDPASGDPGVRFRLVPSDDVVNEVDVLVDITEGTTGQILWGLGVSSNTGLFGNIAYNKRNFDIAKLPTGWSPGGWIRQVLDNEAFHGGGQTLNLDLAPGTELSTASMTFYEPDLFGSHLDTIGLGLSAYRRIRIFRAYEVDRVGGSVKLDKQFGRDLRAGITMISERVKVSDIVADAPKIVWDAEGKHDVRALEATASIRDLDRLIQTTSGFRASVFTRYAPDWLGGDVNFWRAGLNATAFVPLHTDSRERSHVLKFRNSLQLGRGIDGDEDLFLTERLFMGGHTSLRGFRYRGAGPVQFDRPTGGETMLLSTLEYGFPLFSTRLAGQLRETELIRGVVFVDHGLLGDRFDDPLFEQSRLTAGFGFRLRIPGFGATGIPIAIDLGWPLMREDTDRPQVVSWSLSFQ